MSIMRFILPFLLLGSQINAYADVKMITGAGATFPYPVYEEWAKIYKKKYNVLIDYQPVGSAPKEIELIDHQIDKKIVTFGIWDRPLSKAELNKNGLTQFPTLLEAVVPVYNLAPSLNKPLKLNGEVLSEIFTGKIKEWSDPKIAELNPGVTLPEQDIKVIYRSDDSGASFVFAQFLGSINPSLKTLTTNDGRVVWPIGKGAMYNEGVAQEVTTTSGAIGFVHYSFLGNTALQYALVENKAGFYPKPSIKSIQAAFNQTKLSETGELIPSYLDKNSWPIVSANYIFMKAKQPLATINSACTALNFLNWAYKEGSQYAISLHYATIPDTEVTQIELRWKKQFIGNDQKPLPCLAQ